jgi:hypothetical protein
MKQHHGLACESDGSLGIRVRLRQQCPVTRRSKLDGVRERLPRDGVYSIKDETPTAADACSPSHAPHCCWHLEAGSLGSQERDMSKRTHAKVAPMLLRDAPVALAPRMEDAHPVSVAVAGTPPAPGRQQRCDDSVFLACVSGPWLPAPSQAARFGQLQLHLRPRVQQPRLPAAGR